ncbi:MAG: hypothetical protein MUF49_06345 [Oculatellaceae cyanobacterium Prado106]|nr:hypothetical protein [Oculatellaceae cyanobacterium Prado106]
MDDFHHLFTALTSYCFNEFFHCDRYESCPDFCKFAAVGEFWLLSPKIFDRCFGFFSNGCQNDAIAQRLIIPEVEILYGLALRNKAQELVIAYHKGAIHQVSAIDLKQRKVVSTQPFTDLGTEVK